LRGGFDLAVHFNALLWPSTWATKLIGRSRWILTARPSHPLPKRASLKQILEYSFVIPTYWTSEGLAKGNDQFPLPISKRKAGYETATADAAIPILIETDQIAFLPELLVKPFIEAKKLREVRVDELPVIEKDLFLSAKSDVVPDAIFKGLLAKMSAAILDK
jgi:DNA-binding transcriptional LysR family regulator